MAEIIGENELRRYELDLMKDKHYILYNNSKGFNSEIGKVTFKYAYITIKMQLEIDKLKAKIVSLELTQVQRSSYD